MSDSFFDMPRGYSDADMEMSGLERRARAFRKRYRGLERSAGDQDISAAVQAAKDGAIVGMRCQYVDERNIAHPYLAFARMVDEDELGPILAFSCDDGATWHETRKAARIGSVRL